MICLLQTRVVESVEMIIFDVCSNRGSNDLLDLEFITSSSSLRTTDIPQGIDNMKRKPITLWF